MDKSQREAWSRHDVVAIARPMIQGNYVKIAFIGLLVSLLQGCATPAAEQRAPASVSPEVQRTTDSPEPLTLGYGDVFEVRVYDEPQLSGSYRILDTGTISFPLIGQVMVAHLTVEEAAALLSQKLQGYLKRPQVSIFIKEFRSKRVYVFGFVKAPGTFPFESGMSIVQAITMAGGFQELADQNGTYINRIIDGKETRLEVAVKDIGQGKASNVTLNPGDIVFVPESIF